MRRVVKKVQDARFLTQLPPIFLFFDPGRRGHMDIKKTIPLQNARDPEEFRNEQLGKLKQASKMYERQFLGEMVKAMRGTVQRSDLIPETFGEKLFKDKLDQEYITNWSDQGGVGLGDMIYTQLKERYFPEKVANFGHIQGPLPTNQKSEGELRMHKLNTGDGSNGPIEIEIKPKMNRDQSQTLVAPWSGRVVHSGVNEDGSKSLILDHGRGVKSSLKHSGSLKNLDLGQVVEAGEGLGELKGERAYLNWKIWS